MGFPESVHRRLPFCHRLIPCIQPIHSGRTLDTAGAWSGAGIYLNAQHEQWPDRVSRSGNHVLHAAVDMEAPPRCDCGHGRCVGVVFSWLPKPALSCISSGRHPAPSDRRHPLRAEFSGFPSGISRRWPACATDRRHATADDSDDHRCFAGAAWRAQQLPLIHRSHLRVRGGSRPVGRQWPIQPGPRHRGHQSLYHTCVDRLAECVSAVCRCCQQDALLDCSRGIWRTGTARGFMEPAHHDDHAAAAVLP